jgi:hypothetical protein
MGRTEITFSDISNWTVPAGGRNSKAIEIDFSKIRTPEIYLGYRLAQERLGNTENLQPDQTVSYTIAHNNNSSNTDFKPNMVYLEGR